MKKNKPNQKPRISTLPVDVLLEITKGMEHGIEVYGENDWAKGISWRLYYDKIQRHLMAWMSGEDLDPETGIHHITKVIDNAVILRAMQLRGLNEFDDRPNIQGGE